MPLRLKNDSKPAIASRLLLIMVNPFSSNAEATGRMLEEMVLHPSYEWQTIFVQNGPVGIPAENSPEGWEVTPESAQIYYNAVPYIWLETQEVHLLLGEYGLNSIHRFITGDGTADEFVAQLDQLLFTIQSEAL